MSDSKTLTGSLPGRLREANILPVAPGDQSGGKRCAAAGPSRRQVEDGVDVSRLGREPRLGEGASDEARPHRPGQLAQSPGGQADPGRVPREHAPARRRGEVVEEARVLAQQPGGAGQRVGDAATRRALDLRKDPAAHRDPQERGVPVHGVATGTQVQRRQNASVSARRTSSMGRIRPGALGWMPASASSPPPRRAANSTVSAWSSRV